MKKGLENRVPAWPAPLATALAVSLWAAPALANDDQRTPHVLESPALHAIHQAENGQHAVPYPLTQQAPNSGLSFDLGGSEKARLELQLNQRGSGLTGQMGADAGIGFSLTDGFDVGLGLSAVEQKMPFQTLGSIQCHDGVLSPGSYRASDCQFVNEDSASRLRTNLGARYQAPGGISSSLNVFQEQSEVSLAGGAGYTRIGGAPMLNAGLLTPVLTNPLLPNQRIAQPLDYIRSEMTGVDIQFAVGMATGHNGDLQLGLQLTRVMDADWSGTGLPGLGTFDWSLADPFDAASLSLDWNVGSFSSGIQSFYREQVNFLNRESLDSMATFDVHFTWRTPWNASLSLGASNVLNAGQEDETSQPAANDPFESIYGRIPYVRYKQDL